MKKDEIKTCLRDLCVPEDKFNASLSTPAPVVATTMTDAVSCQLAAVPPVAGLGISDAETEDFADPVPGGHVQMQADISDPAPDGELEPPRTNLVREHCEDPLGQAEVWEKLITWAKSHSQTLGHTGGFRPCKYGTKDRQTRSPQMRCCCGSFSDKKQRQSRCPVKAFGEYNAETHIFSVD